MMKASGDILVYLGANAHLELVHLLLDLNPALRFVSSRIFSEVPVALRRDRLFKESVVEFDSEMMTISEKLNFTRINEYNLVTVFESVMNDGNLALLWARFCRKTREENKSEVKRYEVVYSLIKCSLRTLLKTKPNALVFSYEPHMLPIYVFKKVAIAVGIKTYTLTISPFIWRLYCEDESGNHDLASSLKIEYNEREKNYNSIKMLIGEKQGQFRTEKPFYEKRELGRNIGRRFLKKLKLNGWNPLRVGLSQLAISEYKKAVVDRNEFIGKKYICFFLQYQPELTTLPDGGIFVHQLFAVQMLYAALAPMDISLVVREHPAQYEAGFDPKWRPKGFYRQIKSFGKNVYLDGIEEDPFTLIENSLAVSSINGTAILEALLHGKPAIAFGKHTLHGFSNTAFVDKFSDEKDMREKIEKAMTVSPQLIIDDVEKFLFSVYPKTYGKKMYSGNDKMSLGRLRKARCDALVQVIEILSK